MDERLEAGGGGRHLHVCQRAHRLVIDVYRSSARLPGMERLALGAQMRQAVVSVPGRIAEGLRRGDPAGRRACLHAAIGALEELRYYLVLARELDVGVDGPGELDIEADALADQLTALAEPDPPCRSRADRWAATAGEGGWLTRIWTR